MFVLANGAFKSGSTWLREIVRHMISFEPIPREFQHPRYPHWVNPKKIVPFLERCDYDRKNYLSKAHIYDPYTRDALLVRPAVRVLNIRRDIRDVLVSHYYHLTREKKIASDFPTYSWRMGRMKAFQIQQYHGVWTVSSPLLYTTSFEILTTRFDEEVQRIGTFLGLDVISPDVERIRYETSLRRLQENARETRKPEEERFFRKGLVGDWQNYFDDHMLHALKEMEHHGLGRVDAIKYKVIFDYRLRLRKALL